MYLVSLKDHLHDIYGLFFTSILFNCEELMIVRRSEYGYDQ